MMAAGGEPVVMDFGLAKRVADVDPNEAKLTRDGGLLGTPSYMAPEQCRGDVAAIGPATDVYALGVMLFEMLTGKTPYTGAMSVVISRILTSPVPPVREFRPDVDSRLDAVCRKAMAKAPGERFRSMAEFAEALGAYLKAPSASPPPLPAPPAAAVVKAPSPVVNPSPFANMAGASPRAAASKKPRVKQIAAARLPWKKWSIMAGAAVCLLLAGLAALWAAGAFRLKTQDGTIVLENLPADAEVLVDGEKVAVKLKGDDRPIEIQVAPGQRKLEIKAGGFKMETQDVTIASGERKPIGIRLEPLAAASEKPVPPTLPGTEDKGFVPLFNGKDLTGWKSDPKQPGNWRVEKGVLIGSGPDPSHLYTERDDYKDFHLRVEARINDGGNSGVYFRTPFSPTGYEAQINSTQQDLKTGSLYVNWGDGLASAPSRLSRPASGSRWR